MVQLSKEKGVLMPLEIENITLGCQYSIESPWIRTLEPWSSSLYQEQNLMTKQKL